MKKIIFVLSTVLTITACGVLKYTVNGTVPYFLMVSDSGSHRVLFWFSPPTVNQQGADMVIGQPSMGVGTSNNTPGAAGTVSAYGFFTPRTLFFDGINLFAMDQNNHRLLYWRSLPTYFQQPADLVIGQIAMGNNSANAGGGVTGIGLNTPNGVWVANQRLFLADLLNSRVLIWNSLPTSNGQTADMVLGQPDLVSAVTNNTPSAAGTISNQSLFRPSSVTSDGTKLLVADRDNNRILIWNTLPTSTQQGADLVLGQATMATGTASTTANGISNPLSISVCKNRLYVVDNGNRRILGWNSFPTSNGQAADIVLGQPDFVSSTANNTPGAPGTVSSQSINGPGAVHCDGQRLYVCDGSNNRVLIWNSLPTTNQQPADVVLGQPDMAANTANNAPGAPGTRTSQTLSGGLGVISNPSQTGLIKNGGY